MRLTDSAEPTGVPDACQVVRGTTGNSSHPPSTPAGQDTASQQANKPAGHAEPKLPKLMAPYVELSSSREQLPHSHPLPAQALPDSLHGALRWGDTAGTSVRKPRRMERLLPSARWWRPPKPKPKPTCLYSSPTSAHAGASGTAAPGQAERLVLVAEVALHGLVRGAA
jgi:hypothetical protein